ncbi:MAG: hypothetical protein HKN36_12570 [Hellea sp.]|nr:hypothetical protein [Hellea sp.]
MTLWALISRAVVVFILLTLLYIILTIGNHWKQVSRLERAYKETKPEMDKDAYIDAGMKKYKRSLKAKLVLGVYLVPLALFGLLTYLYNL